MSFVLAQITPSGFIMRHYEEVDSFSELKCIFLTIIEEFMNDSKHMELLGSPGCIFIKFIGKNFIFYH